jgi:hypothetical protein
MIKRWTAQLDYSFYSVGLNQRKKQMLELQFSKGRLIYFKYGIFGVSGSCSFHFNLDCLKPYPRGDHIKSNKLNIEYPRKFVDQRSPSSSEDG